MALTMADFIEKKGLGQDVDPNQVMLGPNDLAKLGLIQGLDFSSGYGGLGIQQAQELTSDLPQAADLGLVVEQNKQLQAAGGRGYVGNVHNLQGQSTPFEQLTANIAASKASSNSANPANQVPDRGGIPQEQIGLRGDGNGGSGGFNGMDLGTMGAFGQEAVKDTALGTLGKGLTSGALAYGIGAPFGAAAKFGLSSMFGPLGALLGIGKIAYGGALDMAADQRARDYDATGQSKDESSYGGYEAGYGEGYDDPSRQQSMMGSNQRAAFGMDIDPLGSDLGQTIGVGTPASDFMSSDEMAVSDIKSMSTIDQMKAAYRAILDNPWSQYTGGLAIGSDPMGVSKAMGLQSSFGDPMGFGIGGGRNGGDRGGNSGGNMGGGSAPGGVSGDRGDRGSGMGAGVM